MFDLPESFWLVVVFAFGSIWGSFANVVILRMPAGESVVLPASRCRSCNQSIPWYLNIPILGWFLALGKCGKCRAKFSFRYPLVEFLVAASFVAVYLVHGWSISTLEFFYFSFALITVSFIDIDHFILPDKFTLSGIVIGVLGSFINPDRSWVDSVLGVLLGGGFLWAIAYFYYVFRKEEGMGGGDIKLLAWIGAMLGWQSIPFVIIVASISGSVLGLVLAVKQDKGLKTVIPFGPYLALGAMVIVLGGKIWADTYLRLFLPFLE